MPVTTEIYTISETCEKPSRFPRLILNFSFDAHSNWQFTYIYKNTQTCIVLSCVQLFETAWTVAHQALPDHAVGCHTLLQEIFPSPIKACISYVTMGEICTYGRFFKNVGERLGLF